MTHTDACEPTVQVLYTVVGGLEVFVVLGVAARMLWIPGLGRRSIAWARDSTLKCLYHAFYTTLHMSADILVAKIGLSGV